MASLIFGLVATLAEADELELSINNGRVTIHAQDVSVKEILAEWGRVGHTTIVDGDQLDDQHVTLELVDVSEAQALRTLLRNASGYMAAPRALMSDGISRFDRILILASSKPAARTGTVASPGGAPAASTQRLGAVLGAAAGRMPFTVSPRQQEQLDQLQQVIKQPGNREDEPEPADVQSVFGNVPAARPGMPMTGAGGQEPASVPTGAFGSTTAAPNTGDTPTGTRSGQP